MKPPKQKKKDLLALKETKVKNTLKDEFEKLKSTPLTRTIKLQFRECTDCTCPFEDIERTVSYDSPLKKGDKIYGELEKGDKLL